MLDDQVRTADRKRLKRRRPEPSPRWHLDEMVCSIGGRQIYLWRAVDDEGEVLDLVVQPGRDTEAALKLLRRLLHNQPVDPQTITMDGLASYSAALDQLDLRHLHRPGRLRENDRVENSHLPIRRRERQQQRFKSQASARRFLTTPATICNTFNIQRQRISTPILRRFRAEGGVSLGGGGRLRSSRLGRLSTWRSYPDSALQPLRPDSVKFLRMVAQSSVYAADRCRGHRSPDHGDQRPRGQYAGQNLHGQTQSATPRAIRHGVDRWHGWRTRVG